jgi:PAS domain S-box-containing protein
MASYVKDNKNTKEEPYDMGGIAAALQFSPFPSLIVDPEENKFRILAVNNSFLQLAATVACDFVGKNVEDLLKNFSVQNKQAFLNALKQVHCTKTAANLEIPRSEMLTGKYEEQPVDFLYCDIYAVQGSGQDIQLLVVHLREVKKDLTEHYGYGVAEIGDVLIKSELETEKEKYEDLFNLNPLPQFVYDFDTLEFLYVNDAAELEYGYSKAEFLKMSLMDIRPEEDRSLLADIISNKVIKGHLGSSTVRHMKRNGEIMHVNVQGNSVRYHGKNARLVVVVNLTEKIHARKALERSEQRFKALVQEGSDLIAIISADGLYHYVNPNSKAIIGVPSEFYIGRNAFEFIHDDDKEMVAEHIGLLTKHKRIQLPPFRFEVNNGEYRWIETVMTNMLDDLSVSGIIANSRDVTERINNDIRVQESIERFNVLSKATSDAVWDWDMKDDKLIWNKGIRGIFGYKVNETEEAWWQKRIHKEDVNYVLQRFQSTIKNKKSRLEVEYRFCCSNGIYKNVLDRMFITYNASGEPIRMIGSMQDITDRTKFTKEIQVQNERLQEISWLQSHGVRAPLARVIGLTNLLSSDLIDQGSSEESLRYLLQSATELDNIIRDIIRKTEGLQNKL